MSEKGKPSEKMGRKATGLNPLFYWIWQQGCRANTVPLMVCVLRGVIRCGGAVSAIKSLKYLSGKTLSRCVSYLLFLVIFQFTALFLTAHTGYPSQVIMEWDPNSEATLAGYKAYYGTQSRNYTVSRDVGNQTSYVITGLTAGTKYFFAVTAYDVDGYESDYSEEVVCTIPNSPITTTISGTATTTIPAITTTTTAITTNTTSIPVPITTTILGTATTTIPAITTTTVAKTTTTTAEIPTTTSTAPGNPTDNQPPVARAGEDKTILLGTTISLDGKGSYDPDEDALRYQWKVASGPAQYILKNATTVMPAFKALSIGTYTIGLVVSDGLHYSAEDSVTITVKYRDDPDDGGGSGNGSNAAPVAIAGDDQTAQVGDIVTLDGSKSYDANNDALQYSWVQVSGPAVTLDSADTIAPSFAALAEDIYTFQLIVSDGLLESAPDTIAVTVEQFETGEIQLIAPENTKPVIDQPVLTWQAEGFDIFKVQISKDEKRFVTIGVTREQSFTIPPLIAKLIASGQFTPVYWRVAGKQFALNSWAASEMRMFYLIDDNYENRGDKIKEAIEKLYWFIRIILKPADDSK